VRHARSHYQGGELPREQELALDECLEQLTQVMARRIEALREPVLALRAPKDHPTPAPAPVRRL
jgi:hypothetical protein